MAINRRDFLTISAAGMAAGLAASSALAASAPKGQTRAGEAGKTRRPASFKTPKTVRRGDMHYRTLGRTGELVSIVGVGGYHLGNPSEEEAIRIVRSAIDAGITFMDNSWDYHGGESERRMGKALRDGYRDKVFLMTKFDGRDRKSAAQQMDESLRRLGTDHVDLMQVHETIRPHDPDLVFAEGGAMEALLEYQKAGKVRFIGFTGHKDPCVHNRMLDMAAKHGVRFDTVQMPLNLLDAHFRSFQHEVLPRLVKADIGVLGMKPLAAGKILETRTVSAPECLRYAMNLPTSTVITGIESLDNLKQAIQVARGFEPLSKEEVAELLSRTRQVAEGRFEQYKTTFVHDSTAQHPQWLGVIQG